MGALLRGAAHADWIGSAKLVSEAKSIHDPNQSKDTKSDCTSPNAGKGMVMPQDRYQTLDCDAQRFVCVTLRVVWLRSQNDHRGLG